MDVGVSFQVDRVSMKRTSEAMGSEVTLETSIIESGGGRAAEGENMVEDFISGGP